MSRDISKENVIIIIKHAFKPLECCVELEDRGNRIGFCVFDDNGETLYNSPSIPVKIALRSQRLNEILLEVRKLLENQEVILEPWET